MIYIVLMNDVLLSILSR